MGTEGYVRAALIFGGAVTAAIGIGHIFLPTAGYEPSVAQSLAAPVRDHFYYLGTYAICSFLLGFAALSFYFAGRVHNSATAMVCAVSAFFWLARFGLELVFPVDLPIFFLERPHAVLTAVTAVVTLCYLAAAFGAVRLQKESGEER